MTPFDFNYLGYYINIWMQNRFLHPILYVEGGWEYWLQIDFPCWLDASYQVQYDFRREVSNVLPHGRLDWLANSQIQIPGIKPCAIEIKAQTHKYLSRTFFNDVMEDVNKLDQLDGNYYDRYVLAAAIDPDVAQRLEDKGFVMITNYNNEVGFYWLTL